MKMIHIIHPSITRQSCCMGGHAHETTHATQLAAIIVSHLGWGQPRHGGQPAGHHLMPRHWHAADGKVTPPGGTEELTQILSTAQGSRWMTQRGMGGNINRVEAQGTCGTSLTSSRCSPGIGPGSTMVVLPKHRPCLCVFPWCAFMIEKMCLCVAV